MTKLELFLRRALVLFIIFIIVLGFVKLVSAVFFIKKEAKTEEVQPIEPDPPKLKNIALTFDDGPHIGYTRKLLKIFEENNIKVTFFVVGKMVVKYPFLLEEIDKGGHEIGNHTYNHPFLTSISRESIVRELELGRNAIKKVTGKNVDLFRPPSGRYNDSVLEIAKARRFKTILWAVRSDDYGCKDGNIIKNTVLNSVKDGNIILMHDGVDATLEALPSIIKTLKEREFQFKRVSEIIGKEDGDILLYRSVSDIKLSQK